jgi:hypothetical protein
MSCLIFVVTAGMNSHEWNIEYVRRSSCAETRVNYLQDSIAQASTKPVLSCLIVVSIEEIADIKQSVCK